MKKRFSVAVQQHFLSHYREALFSLMSSQTSPKPTYTFFSGKESPEGIVTIELDKLGSNCENASFVRWQELKNLWVGKVFLLQPKVIALSLSKEFDCIIYLGSMYHVTTWIGAILAKISGKRVLMWTHGYVREEKGLKGYVRELFYRIADGLLLYGHRGRDLLVKRGFDPKSLYVVYNSLDYSRQKSIRSDWDERRLWNLRSSLFSDPHRPVLVFCGRLTQRKGLELIFQAQVALRARGMPVNVLLVGDGPDQKRLESIAVSLNLLDAVKFYGASYDENSTGPLLMMADLCVSPGEVGLTCIHAMAYGTPVITHDDPGAQGPEWEAIVPGATGDYFRKGDSGSLAESIFNWFSRSRPRQKIADACIEAVERSYTAENQIRIINDAIYGVPAEVMG